MSEHCYLFGLRAEWPVTVKACIRLVHVRGLLARVIVLWLVCVLRGWSMAVFSGAVMDTVMNSVVIMIGMSEVGVRASRLCCWGVARNLITVVAVVVVVSVVSSALSRILFWVMRTSLRVIRVLIILVDVLFGLLIFGIALQIVTAWAGF